jgi:hypothetical protein
MGGATPRDAIRGSARNEVTHERHCPRTPKRWLPRRTDTVAFFSVSDVRPSLIRERLLAIHALARWLCKSRYCVILCTWSHIVIGYATSGSDREHPRQG